MDFSAFSKENLSKIAAEAGKRASKATVYAKEKANDALDGASELTTKSKDAIVSQLDVTGDGAIGIDDIIIKAIQVPGVRVDRSVFLEKELSRKYPKDVVEKAIATTPMLAGIPKESIDEIAEAVINYERNIVSGISAALGVPGGVAMVATVPTDMLQYYGCTLRTVQKLLYLYGFPEIKISDDGDLMLDSGTLNTITLCLGIMCGVGGANEAIKGMAKALAIGVEKQLLNAALTKGVIFPLVKKVLKWFGVSLTKKLFASSIKSAIPVVGGILGGGITFATFKPACSRLKTSLSDTELSNPEHISSVIEDAIANGIITGKVVEGNFEDFEVSDTRGINLPTDYQLVDLEKIGPIMTDEEKAYRKETDNARCTVVVGPVLVETTMPYDNTKTIIDQLHEHIGEQEGVIEVKNGTSSSGSPYVYYIVKHVNIGPDGLAQGASYVIQFNICIDGENYRIHGNFEEKGITGTRDSIVYALFQQAEKLSVDKKSVSDSMKNWFHDPYDEHFNKGLMMNCSENEEFDRQFPQHPLSEARKFVRFLIENN